VVVLRFFVTAATEAHRASPFAAKYLSSRMMTIGPGFRFSLRAASLIWRHSGSLGLMSIGFAMTNFY